MAYKNIKDIAKEVRSILRAKFPKAKFSVTIERFAGGQAMNLYLMAWDESPYADGRMSGYCQFNHYHPDSYLEDDAHTRLTPRAVELMKEACAIANRENWDNSDHMTDYFDVNYYFHAGIGKWNKPFQVK